MGTTNNLRWFCGHAVSGDRGGPAEACGKSLPCPDHPQATPAPIPMLLWCPECMSRHIDTREFLTRPHHTHACQNCGLTWRPAIEPTVGVRFLPGFKNEQDGELQSARSRPEDATGNPSSSQLPYDGSTSAGAGPQGEPVTADTEGQPRQDEASLPSFYVGSPTNPVERCAARGYPHDHVLCCGNPRCTRNANHGGHCYDAEGRQDPLMPEVAQIAAPAPSPVVAEPSPSPEPNCKCGHPATAHGVIYVPRGAEPVSGCHRCFSDGPHPDHTWRHEHQPDPRDLRIAGLGAEKRSAIAILSRATNAKYPNAPQELHALAKVAADMVKMMHDALHDADSKAREAVRTVTQLQAANTREVEARRAAELSLRACGGDEPWTLMDAALTLATAADHLLVVHDCDKHRHEAVRHAIETVHRLAAIREKEQS